MLNELNLELQGKEKTVVNMISSVTAFKRKMQHLSSKLQRHDLGNFQNLASELEMQQKACAQLDSARSQSSLTTVCQSLTNIFKTLLYSSQLLHLCATHFV